ncbi:MAG TPA: DUF362 domain-containing protein [Candidatus Hydrogenedentes bacterium]|nr:DUF362 domain-containing protein [Candidatus Hydrogenedentota bacterium]HIJ73088.1 DUF362 domain-containing protein [Candidatus Hydrogenedentota bacterium]
MNGRTVAVVDFTTYARSVAAALDAIAAPAALRGQPRIFLKPNLITDAPHPVTTPPECVEAVLDYCRAHSNASVAVAEGAGGLDTTKAYRKLGYDALSARKNVPLIDLDREELVRLENPNFEYLPELYLPRCLLHGFLISIPVLKAHSMSQVTLTLKNMMGVVPAKYYKSSAFRKSKLHGRNNRELHRYILELNQYRKPDLTVLDATVGMAEAHLWGRTCEPPVNKILASFDPVAIDAAGTQLLGFDWRTIDHIASADGLLGHADGAFT